MNIFITLPEAKPFQMQIDMEKGVIKNWQSLCRYIYFNRQKVP